MKTTSNVLQEWDDMTPLERAAFIIKHGKALVFNIATFVVVANTGVSCQAAGNALIVLITDLNGTEEAENAMKAQDEIVIGMLNANKLSVEGYALGSCTIIQLAGMKCTSKNTTMTGIPVIPVAFAFDKKSVIKNQLTTGSKAGANVYAGLVFGWTDASVSILRVSGDQIVISVGSVEVLLNVSTTTRNTMTGLTSGEELSVEKFDVNPSGLSAGTGTVESIVP
jgi:hypothetical protein